MGSLAARSRRRAVPQPYPVEDEPLQGGIGQRLLGAIDVPYRPNRLIFHGGPGCPRSPTRTHDTPLPALHSFKVNGGSRQEEFAFSGPRDGQGMGQRARTSRPRIAFCPVDQEVPEVDPGRERAGLRHRRPPEPLVGSRAPGRSPFARQRVRSDREPGCPRDDSGPAGS